ncbi:MAG: hypothetical protein AB7T63_10025 [Planctomycetota bacterium]
MAAKADTAPGDPLKYYCIVFAVLIAVIGFVWFRIRGQLEEYKAENAFADKLLTADENVTDSQGRPRQLAALGLATQRLVAGYASAVGTGTDSTGIRGELIDGFASRSLMEVDRAGTERVSSYSTKGYDEVERDYTFKPTTLDNFITLLYNIENGTRYRVFDVTWRMRPTKENTLPPHHLITAPNVKIGFRRPFASGSGN